MWDNSVFTPETQIVCDSCGSKLTVYSRAQSAVNLVQKGWRTATTSDYGFFGLRCPKCAVKDREIVNTRDDSLAKLGYAFGCMAAADAKLQESEPKEEEEVYKEVHKVTEDITLKEFLLHRTRALQLCTIRSGGWIEGATWIDYEDLFIHSLDKDTLDKKVESYEMGTLKVLDADGNKVDVPCMHIDLA